MMLEWFQWVADPNAWVSLLTLTILEIVLGVDNIIFISILAGKLPAEQQGKARTVGLMLALVTRILLLSLIFVLAHMTKPLFAVMGQAFSLKDLVLLFGGLFLIWKSVKELHHSMEGANPADPKDVRPKFSTVVWTIVAIDILFSLDSVITAVGLVGGGSAHGAEPHAITAAREALTAFTGALGNIPAAAQGSFAQLQAALAPPAPETHGSGSMTIMILAIIISMMVMLAASKSISDFVNRHPTIKMLALSFLILVGFILVADGLGHHVPKGYVYFAMAFSFVVEILNIRMRKKNAIGVPVELRKHY